LESLVLLVLGLTGRRGDDFVAEWANIHYSWSVALKIKHTQGLGEGFAAV